MLDLCTMISRCPDRSKKARCTRSLSLFCVFHCIRADYSVAAQLSSLPRVRTCKTKRLASQLFRLCDRCCRDSGLLWHSIEIGWGPRVLDMPSIASRLSSRRLSTYADVSLRSSLSLFSAPEITPAAAAIGRHMRGQLL